MYKNVHFTYDNTVYKQNNGVAIGSPLGPVLYDIMATFRCRHDNICEK